MPKIATRIFFISLVIGILFLGNLVVYQGMALAFGIHSGPHLTFLALVLGLLTASFIISNIIGNYFYNVVTRASYLLSAIWIGFFTYAFLVSVLFAVLVAFSHSLVQIGLPLYISALLVSIYGLIHARTILIKKVPITLPLLPNSWKDRKAVWISDVHFGQIYGSRFARKIVEHIETLSPDIIFIGGDLFDGTSAPNLEEQIAPLKHLSARFGVYFITGNHEEYGDVSRFLATVESKGMHVLTNELIELDGLQLIGVDYRNTATATEFETVLATFPIDRTRASILLKHGPENLGVAHAANISLQLSGHTHNGQMWPLTYIANMVHKGYAYGLKSYGKMQVYTSSGIGSWGPPLRVGTNSEIVLITFK